MDENERQAATIKVTISNYVATAALGVTAGAAVLYTYISQNFVTPTIFHLLMVGAVAALVLSIVLGGAGSDTIADKVAHDEWRKTTHLSSFNWQAILTLLGLLLVLGATVIGVGSDRQQSNVDKQLDALSHEVGGINGRLHEQSQTIHRLSIRFGRLQIADRSP
jgi:hypothetical protein